jgi:type VI secretion system Hcp family effector
MKSTHKMRMVASLTIALTIIGFSLISIMSNPNANATTVDIMQPSFSSISMNLFIEGVEGESIIAGRENSITASGYSHSISNPYNLATGQVTAKQHSPLRVMKQIDKSSPKLQEKCVTGSVLPSVILKLYYEPNGKNFYTIELTNAQVTSFQGFSTVKPYEVPTETVSFTYESIKWTYTVFDDAGNKMGNVEAQDTWEQQPSV